LWSDVTRESQVWNGLRVAVGVSLSISIVVGSGAKAESNATTQKSVTRK